MQDSFFNKRAEPAPAQSIQGVSRVLEYVRKLIAANKQLAAIKVRGEVSGLSNRDGRLYFKLKEDKDVLECVAWRTDAGKFAPFRDGDEVVCGGDFTAYGPRSQFQLIVKNVELTGAGAIYAQLKALEETFRREGLFDRGRKRPMPAFPRRLAVISARDGRGINDFLTTIARRAPFVRVHFLETRVQGEGAEIEIAQAIDDASKMDVDVILLTRGGGSVEDLFPFNKETVVRAIVRAKHPVMTAIGHNMDIHVSDQVADFSVETPSNAAQHFGEICDGYLTRIERARLRMDRCIHETLTAKAMEYDRLASDLDRAPELFAAKRRQLLMTLERRLNVQTPQRRLAERRNRFLLIGSRLQGAARYALLPRSERLQRAAMRLVDMNPERLLERGYAIVTFQGKPVRDASVVPVGAPIAAKLHLGRLLARVEESQSDG
jgi:exodeoxyribonuclease VII large subunit